MYHTNLKREVSKGTVYNSRIIVNGATINKSVYGGGNYGSTGTQYANTSSSSIDVLDGTPLLDIKPYVPQLYEDTIEELKIGWFEKNHNKAKSQKSDNRFK